MNCFVPELIKSQNQDGEKKKTNPKDCGRI